MYWESATSDHEPRERQCYRRESTSSKHVGPSKARERRNIESHAHASTATSLCLIVELGATKLELLA